MTFAAITKNIKSMYNSSDFERLFIRYKAEAMPRKSMVQGYKTLNRTRTSPRTDGNEYTTLIEVSSSPTPGKKENVEPCPVRMMIDIRMTNRIRIQQRNLTYQNLKSLIEKLEGLC